MSEQSNAYAQAGVDTAAGDLAVEPIGDDGDREYNESRYPPTCFVTVTGEQGRQEHRDQHDAQAGQQIGDVRHAGTRGARIGI